MLDGDWSAAAGLAMDDVWRPAVHVIPGFCIPVGWRVDRSFDWGAAKPYAVCYWAESNGEDVILADGSRRSFPRGTLFLVDEVYGSTGQANTGTRETTQEVAVRIKAKDAEIQQTNGLSVQPGPADSSIFDTATSSGVSIAEEYAQQGVRWVEANKAPGSRKAGLQAIRNRLKASLSQPMEEPGLFVFSRCRHWIDTVPELPRDKRDREDVDSKAEDHLYDATRYRILQKRHEVAQAEGWW